MEITDNTFETKSGAKFTVHCRSLKNDTYSGFIRNDEWPKNCSISIPKTQTIGAFHAIVDTVIDNESKFNSANTLGRPRYYDILSNGLEGLSETNKVFDLREANPEFQTYKNSKRMWYYKSIGGNFNMKSVKINHVKLIDSVSFKKLMPYIDDENVKEVLDGLRRQKFEYEADFLQFCDNLIDATQSTLIHSYNEYMKSLFGTSKKLHRTKKDGSVSMTYYVYVPKDATIEQKSLLESMARQGIPKNANVKVIELSLFEESVLASAEDAKARAEKLEAIKKYFADRKKAKKAKKAA